MVESANGLDNHGSTLIAHKKPSRRIPPKLRDKTKRTKATRQMR
jgi:hypothetical protein